MTTPVSGAPAGCPTCGRPNRDGARFCAACGASLAARCAACGAELDAEARFCDACGTAVGRPPSSAAASSGARKVVTIVFADLAGSTALAERMDPESVRAVMQRYYALIREVVEGREGRIVKFLGDGVMAVFGVPETREDDTLNALHSALAMHDAFAPLAADVARDRDAMIGLRVGVNTGEVVVGDDDNDVVGDAVNLAARLERAAPTGGVLVGESTWRLARGAASFGSELVLHVAGKSEAVRAWPLVATERDTVELRTALVGRARELDLLRRAFDDAVGSGSPRLVTIIGSPGVGKTRLASELERVVDGATVLLARCTQQTGAPLAPIAEMLHAAVGGSAGDPGATVERLRALLGDDRDRDRVLRTVAAVLGSGAGATPEESFWALRRLLEHRARTEPVMLVVDDLQWGEAVLVDLVEHLAQWTRGSLLLVVTARPELREIRGALTDGTRHTVVALEGLDGDATGELACELLGAASLPGELLERLPESTGGNPLFVRELLRMLVDDGVLQVGAEGDWVLGVAPEAIDVPPTIQSLLAARLDRLSPDEQLVLECASVWGAEFPLGALVELLPPSSATRAQAVLEQLRRKELLETAGSYWIDEPLHRFHHVLIRDAAYRRVLRDVRASLHEQLAAWVDTKTALLESEYDELVGHHLEESYRQRCELGPPDDHTVGLGRSAATRIGAAAQRALDRDDPLAASLAGRALACVSADDATRADLLLVRCDALLTAADAVAAREAVAELESIAAASPRLRAWAACFAAQLATITDPARLRETEQRAAAVAAELTELGDARGAAKAHAVHAAALARLGRFAEVEDALDRALTRAREADDRRLATVALAAAPVAAVWGPSPVPRAGGRCLDVVRLLRITAGSPVVEATSLRCQAVLESFRGRTDAARRLVGAARESLLELGLVHGLLEADLFAGMVELGAGELAAAGEALQRAYDGLRGLGADADAARAGALLARVALERGVLADAERLAREAEQLAGDDLQAGIAWRRVAAEVCARRGEHDEALALAETAVGIAAQTDALVHHADACMALAAVRRAAGDDAGAAQAAREASELYERKGATALVDTVRAALDRPAEEPAPVLALSPPLHNLCSEVLETWRASFSERDWYALERLVAADHDFDDRRPIVGMRSTGRGPYLEMLREFVDLGVQAFTPTVRAVRGQRILLAEISAVGTTESVIHAGRAWAVVELADDVTIGSFTIFDDAHSAVAELDRRFIEREGAPFAEMLELVVRGTRAWNTRDWDDLRAVYAPEIINVDGFTAGWGSSDGREALLGVMAQMFTVFEDARAIVREIVACSTDTIVCATGVSATSGDGGVTEVIYHIVYHRAGSTIDRMEAFAEADLDAALAAYRRLAVTINDPTNRCADAYARWTELFAARDWAAMQDVVAPDFVLDDRRAILRMHVEGHAVGRNLSEVADLYGERFSARSVATRGERLALLRSRTEPNAAVSGQFTSEPLLVVESTEDGLLHAIVVFPDQYIDEAVAELDRRYLAGEGAAGAATLEIIFRGNAAYNAGDWGALAETYAPDIVWVDRVSGGWATRRGRDAVMAVLRQIAEGRSIVRAIPVCSDRAAVYTLAVGVVDEVELEVNLLMCRSGEQAGRIEAFGAHELDAALAAFRVVDERREPAERAAVESPLLVVVQRTASDITAMETFADDALDTARGRYRAPSNVVSPSYTIDNLCTRAKCQLCRAVEHRDWDTVGRLYSASLYEGVDRRHGIHSMGAAPVEAYRASADLGVAEMLYTPIAVRGQGLALGEEVYRGRGAGAAEVRLLVVNHVGSDGRFLYNASFDIDDLDTAIADLEDRYLAGDGASVASTWSRVVAGHRAMNARDWHAFSEGCTNDVVTVDHTYGGWTDRRGRDAYVEALASLSEPFPETRSFPVEILAISENAAAYVLGVVDRAIPTDMSPQIGVVSVTASGFDRVETFAFGDRAAALAAYERLASRDQLGNLCTRVGDRLCELFARRDWEAFGTLFAPDFDGDDYRRGFTSFDADPVNSFSMIVELAGGLGRLELRPIAVRGDRLALSECWIFGDEQFVLEPGLFLTEVDGDGRFVWMASYDVDAHDRAFADLDGRDVAGESTATSPDVVPPNRAFLVFHSAVQALVTGDRESFADAHSHGLVSEDRRALMGHVYGRAEMLDDFVRRPDDFELQMVAGRGDDIELHHGWYRGTRVGSEWEFEVLGVAELGADGRIAENVTFDVDDLDAAYAELDRRFILKLQPDDREAAAVWGTVCRWNDGFNRRDSAVVEQVVADDMTYEDHRVAGYGSLERGGVLALADAIVDVTPGARIRFLEIAALNAHGVVARSYVEADTDADHRSGSSAWWLLRVRNDTIRRLETFGVEDRDAAVRHLAILAS